MSRVSRSRLFVVPSSERRLGARAAREAALGAENQDTKKAALELEKLYQAWGKESPAKR